MQYIEIFKIILLLVFFFIFNKLCFNYKFFLNDTSISKHKSFVSKNNKVLILQKKVVNNLKIKLINYY